MWVVRRVVSALIALGVLALSLITVFEVLRRALGHPPWLVDEQAVRDTLGARHWGDRDVLLVLVAMLVLGLGLLALALTRGRPRQVALNCDGTQAASLSVRRRSLEHYLAGVATAQPGVHRARAAVRRGSVKVRADADLGDVPAIRDGVHQAIVERMRSLDPNPTLRTSVSVRSRER
jgi:hypothetical protein